MLRDDGRRVDKATVPADIDEKKKNNNHRPKAGLMAGARQ
jgi:hypothetical protein